MAADSTPTAEAAKTVAAAADNIAQSAENAAKAQANQTQAAINNQAATASNAAAVAALRSEYADLVARGDLTAAGQKLQEINQQLHATTGASAAARAGIATVGDAFKLLGLTSTEALRNTAEQSRAAYDVIRESGTATARDVREAFRIAAQAAIDAADGVAPAWVRAEAGMRGYVVQVDQSGKSVLKLASEINAATAATGNLQGAWQGVGAAIEDAAEKAKRVKKESADAAEAAETADRERRRMASVKIDRPRETYEQAKASGLSESQALAVMNEFWQNGNKAGWHGPSRYGDTWSYLVVKKIDELVLANAQQRAAEEARAPAQPTTTPATTQQPGGGGATYVSNITLPSGKTAQVRFADGVSQSQAEEILRQLAAAKGAAA